MRRSLTTMAQAFLRDFPPKLLALGAFGYAGRKVIERAQGATSRRQLGGLYLACLALLALRNLHKPLRPAFVATLLADGLCFLQAMFIEETELELGGVGKELGAEVKGARKEAVVLRLDAQSFGECLEFLEMEEMCRFAMCSPVVMRRVLAAVSRSTEVAVQAVRYCNSQVLSMSDLKLLGLQRRSRDAKAAFQRRREKVYMIEEGGVNSVECNRLHPDFGVAKAIFSLRKIHIPNLEVALSISCGEHHIAVVMQTGHLYTWGKCVRGELGHGLAEEVCDYPRRVLDAIAGEEVVQASCGSTHTACVSAKGALYTFGNGRQGRLGNCECRHSPPSRKDVWREGSRLPNKRCDRSTPTLVDTKENELFHQVSCGREHTAAVTMSGKLYTFGSARDAALGHEEGVDVFWDCCYSPKLCVTRAEADSPRFTKVECSFRRTMALSHDGHLYVSGAGARLTKLDKLDICVVNFHTSATYAFVITHDRELLQVNIAEQTTSQITPVHIDGASAFADGDLGMNSLTVDQILPVSNCLLLRNRTGSFYSLKVDYLQTAGVDATSMDNRVA